MLKRYTAKPYRGFESLRLRHILAHARKSAPHGRRLRRVAVLPGPSDRRPVRRCVRLRQFIPALECSRSLANYMDRPLGVVRALAVDLAGWRYEAPGSLAAGFTDDSRAPEPAKSHDVRVA